MSEELESRLRAAFRPVAPSDEFTQNLITRVAANQRSPSNTRGVRERSPKASA